MQHLTRIALIGNHVPRRCGIATFTADVATWVQNAGAEVEVIALNDEDGYDYPPIVTRTIRQHHAEDYAAVAAYLNAGRFDAVLLQHEYGIFGGDDGRMILELLKELKPPVVTTLHTILAEPSAGQKETLQEIAQLSERVITMSERGVRMLRDIYRIPAAKIAFTYHGIPVTDCPQDWERNPRRMLTFGLLGPDKGIEHVIQALPSILDRHPEMEYWVVGATHPHLRKHQGESYRESLQTLAEELNVAHAVRFVDKFVTDEELERYLCSADIYVTPYLKPNQITSGTLSFAFGMGKAVVSTPYWHAEELLADGRGVLVPFRDAGAIAREVNALLDNPSYLIQLRKNAHAFGRQMRWSEVGKRYLGILQEARDAAKATSVLAGTQATKRGAAALPSLDLRHLIALTDDTGMLQHATYSVPNRFEGYCTDDNARAAILTVQLSQLPETREDADRLLSRYLSFLHYAYDPARGLTRNFMGYERTWLETEGSEDSQGRAVWAFGVLGARAPRKDQRLLARRLFEATLPHAATLESPRTRAFVALGCAEMLRSEPTHPCRETLAQLADELRGEFLRNGTAGWRWLEDVLAYDNARLPEALLAAGEALGRREFVTTGLDALKWLLEEQQDAEGHFCPIGSDGFYRRGADKATFDQQPLEAAATIDACLRAHRITGERSWFREAERAFEWFRGGNKVGVSLIDPETGGCYDGLHPTGANQNQGAESLLAWLSSLTAMRAVRPTVPAATPAGQTLGVV